MALTAPDLRHTLAKAWVGANVAHPALAGRGPEELANSLAEAASTDPLWPGFEETQLREIEETWSWLDMDTYGAATDPRPATPNEEVVVFVDTTTPGLITEPDGTLRVPEDMAVPGKTLLMRYYESAPDHGISIRIGDVENNWRVAALYEETA